MTVRWLLTRIVWVSGLFTIDPNTQDSTNCTFTMDFYYTYELEILEFKIIIFLDERNATLNQYMEVVEGDPPEIDVDSPR